MHMYLTSNWTRICTLVLPCEVFERETHSVRVFAISGRNCTWLLLTLAFGLVPVAVNIVRLSSDAALYAS